MTDPTTEQQREMLDLRAKTQAWIDSLLIAGIQENAAVAAMHTALVERALVSGGVDKTADWLNSMARMVRHSGSELLTELRKQGH